MKLWKFFGPPMVLVVSVLVWFSTIACGSAAAGGGDPAVATARTASGEEQRPAAKTDGDTPAAETAASADSAAADLPPEAFSGLYYGAIVYRPGGTEIEIVLELGVDGEGKMAGTLDMLAYPTVTYKPLENFAIDGREVYFNYRHFSEVRGPDALFEFEAELAEGAQRLDGGFLEQRGRIPFTLERIGDPGAPRTDLEPRPLADLAGADDLEQRLNAHPDHAHLVLLLSPT